LYTIIRILTSHAVEQAKRKYADSDDEQPSPPSGLALPLKPKPSLRPKRSGIPVLSPTQSHTALRESSKNQLKPAFSTQELGTLGRRVSSASLARRESSSLLKKAPIAVPTPVKEERSVFTRSSAQKENAVLRNSNSRDALRRPLGPRIPTSPSSPGDSSVEKIASRSDQRAKRDKENVSASSSQRPTDRKRKVAPARERAHRGENPDNAPKGRKALTSPKLIEEPSEEAADELPLNVAQPSPNPNVSVSDSVRSRIVEWANARDRLREMSMELEAEIESEIEFGRDQEDITEVIAPNVEESVPATPLSVDGKQQAESAGQSLTRLQSFLPLSKPVKENVPQDVHSGGMILIFR
jgi:hypothetical protein